jgi:hypothetical protein
LCGFSLCTFINNKIGMAYGPSIMISVDELFSYTKIVTFYRPWTVFSTSHCSWCHDLCLLAFFVSPVLKVHVVIRSLTNEDAHRILNVLDLHGRFIGTRIKTFTRY